MLLVAFLAQDSCKQRVNSLPIRNKPISVLSFITPSSSKLYASMSNVTICIYYNNMLIYIYCWLVLLQACLADQWILCNMVLPCIHPSSLNVSGQQSKFSPIKYRAFVIGCFPPPFWEQSNVQKLLKPSKSENLAFQGNRLGKKDESFQTIHPQPMFFIKYKHIKQEQFVPSLCV